MKLNTIYKPGWGKNDEKFLMERNEEMGRSVSGLPCLQLLRLEKENAGKTNLQLKVTLL